MNVPRLRVSRRLPGTLDRVTVLSGAGGELPIEALAPGLATTLRELARGPAWSGRFGRRFERLSPGGAVVELAGVGPLDELADSKLSAEIAAAVERAGRAGARRLGIVLPAFDDGEGPSPEPIARAAALAEYRFERFRQPAGENGSVEEILFVPADAAATAWRDGVRNATAIAGAVAWTRDLANSPPNEATPAWIAARARELARRTGARSTELGPAEMHRRGMGGILAVGGGSAHPPRMVRLAWGSRGPVVALVGKGVTFDSGGISIKPAAAMDEMKWDKCGACTVLGVLHAAAALELPVRLRLYLPLAENMLGAAAYRPGDIVRCANGKTVEILNTDAEGRLIVADALSWATGEKPDALLELSTLTGACVVALGQGAAGLFTPDDGLAGSLLAAAEASGERLWRLPLWPEFAEEMKGAHADLRNVAGRWGGASTAAAFLSQFVGGVARWAHLDIAGPAYVGGEDRARRGATGYGVATVVRWLAGIGREGALRRAR